MSLSLTSLVGDPPPFRTHDGVRESIESACMAHSDVASFRELGKSEEGRSLYGVVLGDGDQTVSLVAGHHADEPVGPRGTTRTNRLGRKPSDASFSEPLTSESRWPPGSGGIGSLLCHT